MDITGVYLEKMFRKTYETDSVGRRIFKTCCSLLDGPFKGFMRLFSINRL